MENELKLRNKPKILGLDVSSKTIGWAIFDMNNSTLLEASHFSPKIKPEPEDKIEILIRKAEAFKHHLEKYKDYGTKLHRPKRKMGQIISKKRNLSLILPLDRV